VIPEAGQRPAGQREHQYDAGHDRPGQLAVCDRTAASCMLPSPAPYHVRLLADERSSAFTTVDGAAAFSRIVRSGTHVN